MTSREDQPLPLDCSVVIPVFNRGESLVAGSESLRAQSIGTDRFEIIYVDDGSTDGYTPALIDAAVAAAPNARVFHEPASGSPGRPRNVGLAHAQGEFVFFSDHDDWFDPRTLERLVAWARHHGSDVVIGKVVGHGRRTRIPRIFEVSRASVPAPEAMISLTPHKLFRRAFLEEHDIRYPEGKRRLEDHHFVTHAYLHASVISVYADHVCYHHNDPGTDENFSQTRSDPALYVQSNVEVIDLIGRHTEDDPLRRDAMLERPVLHELIKKAAPGQLKQVDAKGEARKHDAIRDALRSIPVEVIDRLEAFPRATARAVLNDDAAGVVLIASAAEKIGLVAELVALSVADGQWRIDLRATVVGAGDADDDGAAAITNVELLAVNRRSEVSWHLPVAFDADKTSITGNAALQFGVVGPEQINEGVWDLVLFADVLGLPRRTRLSAAPDQIADTASSAELHWPGAEARMFVTERGTLALRVATSGRRAGA